MKKTLIAAISATALVISCMCMGSCAPTRAYAGVEGAYQVAPGTTAYYGIGYKEKHHPKPPKHKKHKHHKPPKKYKHDRGNHYGHYHDD